MNILNTASPGGKECLGGHIRLEYGKIICVMMNPIKNGARETSPEMPQGHFKWPSSLRALAVLVIIRAFPTWELLVSKKAVDI